MFDLSVEDFIDTKLALEEPEHDLIDFLKTAGWDTYKSFVKMATDEPRIFKALTKVYNIEDLKIEFPSDKVAANQAGEASNKRTVKSVSLVSSDDVMDSPEAYEDMDAKEKEKVISKGYTIKDLRGEDEKSDLYLGDFKKEFSQVTESGYYQILNKNSQLVKALVFAHIKPVNGPKTHNSEGFDPQLVVDPQTGAHKWSKQPVYFRSGASITEKVDEDTQKTILDKTGDKVKSAEVGKSYLIIDSKLGVYGPFSVKNKLTDKGKVSLVVRQEYVSYPSHWLLQDAGSPSYHGCGSSDSYDSTTTVKLVDRESGPVEYARNIIYVAKDAKVIELKDAYDFENSEKGKTLEDLITPGEDSALYSAISANDGAMVVIEKSASFDVNVSLYNVSKSFRERSNVVLDLMTRANLSEDAAEKFASEVFDKKVRKAIGWTLPRENAKLAYPDVMDPQGYMGAMRDGTPEQAEQVERQEMVPASVGPRPATELGVGDWKTPSQDDIKFLERASDSNSRQVFDPAMIGVMVRTSRSQAIVADYIPELVDNLDRMCRLLLLFYWHNSEFADEYGIDEMADFEDLILSTIKSTSKVVLFLKQKAVESSTGQTDVLE